jgi:mannose-1-phosphate guanylyltransferase
VSRVHAVILAGGRGTRFWPASREAFPKQFLTVGGGASLIRRTAERVLPLASPERLWVITNSSTVDMAASHLPMVARRRIIGEPVGRNTAPAVALAAELARREDPDAVLLVAPADHWIADEDAFRETARRAIEFAASRAALVTFGISPTSPETGYGYIEAGDEVSPGMRRVARFTEKPNRPTAEAFLAGGRHFWNSGIFVWRAQVVHDELARHSPEMVAACERMASAPDPESAVREGWAKLPSISIDYALLERSENVYVAPSRFAWSDIGSWDAWAALGARDASGNVVEGDALVLDSSGCFVRSGPGRFSAILGLEDVLVLDTKDALLVCRKDRAQDVKKIVDALEAMGRRDLL